MKKHWWKWLGVVLYLYVLIGGIITPLKPGIVSTNIDKTLEGKSVTLNITGYNTHFANAKHNVSYLKLGSEQFLKATIIKPKSEQLMDATFSIPMNHADQSCTLLTYNEVDGVALLPSALYIMKNAKPDSSITTSAILSRPDVNINSTPNFGFPYRSILEETIRNTFFHVAIWMAMFALFLLSNFYAVMYLIRKERIYDFKSESINKTGILLGILGLITGSLWARYTWGTWWTDDIKLNMAALAMIIYGGYVILRSSISDIDKKARVSAVFSIFAFVALIPLLIVIPRLGEVNSLHPGNGGNPALGGEDLDHTLRMFFYPAIIALFLLGLWISQLKWRYEALKFKVLTK